MAEIVQEESAKVFRCISRLIEDPIEAESILQETFLQAMLKIESFRGDSKISTWLCSIGINLARAFLRKRKRLQPMSEDDFKLLQPKFDESGHHVNRYNDWNPSANLERKETVEAVRTAIARLPDKYQSVVILCDIQELGNSEVAEMLGITDGALRVRLHRARNALRQLLDEYFRSL